MDKERIESGLRQVAEQVDETAPLRLAEAIKARIPSPLPYHRGTVSIIVHLRISRWTAVASIAATLIISAFLFGGGNDPGSERFLDFRALVEFLPGREADQASVLAGLRGYYLKLREEGHEAVYLGELADPESSTDLLIYWRLPEGKYRVIFADFRQQVVAPDELIVLQARMLQNQGP